MEKESSVKIGGKIISHSYGTYWMDTYENAFRTTRRFNTYEELAEYVKKAVN
jgi:protoporphyrinogen oxidase